MMSTPLVQPHSGFFYLLDGGPEMDSYTPDFEGGSSFFFQRLTSELKGTASTPTIFTESKKPTEISQ